MQYYSMRNPVWRYHKLGRCSRTTIGGNGCFLTALSMLCGRPPHIANDLLKKRGGFVQGCMISSETAARTLGLDYFGRSSNAPNYDSIIESRIYWPRYSQHFVVRLQDGRIVDPMDKNPVPKKKYYKVISYRLFRARSKKKEKIGSISVGEVQKLAWFILGRRMPAKEAEWWAKKIGGDIITDWLRKQDSKNWERRIKRLLESD